MNATRKRDFIDTNILVYAHDRSAGVRHQHAQELIGDLWAARVGCLSIQVLQEFYVVVTRKVRQPLKPADAAQIIQDLALWTVHSPSTADVLSAIKLQSRWQLCFWDAMILQSAHSLGCQRLWSEDLSHGQQIGRTTIQSPFR